MAAKHDSRFMDIALRLADQSQGRTGSNPAVGCVITNDDCIIGCGRTGDGGRPHAESIALAQAEGKTLGATLYTTLEPCAHSSPRGPSCLDLIKKSGVTRVVIACLDPDPRTDGTSVTDLKQAGIEVLTGLCRDQAERSIIGFTTRLRLERPWVALKLATTHDGAIALENGASQWITSPQARRSSHVLRSRCDAVAVGTGTVFADNPRLDVRIAGLERYSPRVYVLGKRSLTTDQYLKDRASHIASHDPVEVLNLIAQDGVNRLLIEGGAIIAGAFLKADLVDCIYHYQAPIIAGNGRKAVAVTVLKTLDRAVGLWNKEASIPLGPDDLHILWRNRP